MQRYECHHKEDKSEARGNRYFYWDALWVARIYAKTPDSVDRYRRTVYFGAPPIPAHAVFCDLSTRKSQVGTLLRVGIHLPKSVFSRVQLEVALSRARKRSYIRAILLFTEGLATAREVVFEELLH